MIEKIIYDYLNETLDVPVSVTKQDADEYVLIEKIGSSVTNHIHRDTFAFQSYSKTLLGAAELNNKVKNALDYGLIELSIIASVKCINDYNFTDTTTKQYRYQSEYDITNYKTP